MEKGDCFAVERGQYAGKFIVYIGAYGNRYQFLMMPGNFQILSLSDRELKFAQEDTLIQGVPPYMNFVENLPQDVFSVIESQYNEIKKSGLKAITSITLARK